MAKKSRIRAHRGPSARSRRLRELAMRPECNVVTPEQKATEARAAGNFMDAPHLLRCSCGTNTRETIVDASRLGWLVLTKNRPINRISQVRCPSCSNLSRRKKSPA